MTPTPSKKYECVLTALRGGAETSREISDDTGLSIEIACAHLCYLERKKLALRVGAFHHHDTRRASTRWRAA